MEADDKLSWGVLMGPCNNEELIKALDEHERKKKIKHDLELYGIAYERLLPDGRIEHIDPTTIRVIKIDDIEK